MDNMFKTQINTQKNIFYYWDIIKKWKKLILFSVIIITIIATVISFILPQWYYSYAVIKPSDQGGSNIFSAVLGAKGLSALGKNLSVGGLQYSDLDYYQSLLRSRKISLGMITEFDLKKTYGQKYIFKTIEQLTSNSQFQTDPKSNLLIIGVYDRNPTRAKEMVSSYLQFLDTTINEISKVSLISNREMIEKRYKQNVSDLDSAQTRLKNFQETYGVVLPEEQFSSTIKAYAEIEAQKLLLESQLNGLIYNLGPNSPAVKSLQVQINTLNSKLSQMSKKDNYSSNQQLFVSLGKAPDLIDKYVSIYREVTIQSKLLELTYPLYQQAKLDELQEAPPFVIIDKPFVPEYKAKPKRAIIILSGFGISLIMSIFYVFISESIRKLKQEYYTNL